MLYSRVWQPYRPNNTTLTTRIGNLEAENTTLTAANMNPTAQVNGLANSGGGGVAGGAAGGGARAATATSFATTPALVVQSSRHHQLFQKSGNGDL
jgi:hypothetical protein